jgi:hypothetical protein
LRLKRRDQSFDLILALAARRLEHRVVILFGEMRPQQHDGRQIDVACGQQL